MSLRTHDAVSNVVGQQLMVGLQVDFDSSYPTGGEPLDLPRLTGIRNIERVEFEELSGYAFEYDRTNAKLKAFQAAGSHTHVFAGTALGTHTHIFTGSLMGTHSHDLTVTVDEVVAVSANVSAALAHLPGAISMVYAAAGGVTGPCLIVPTGVVPATGQVAVNWSTGVLTFAAGDTVSSAKVTYVQKVDGAALNSAGTPAGTNAAASAGTPAGTNAANAGGALAEVPNATDLSALQNVRLVVVGT